LAKKVSLVMNANYRQAKIAFEKMSRAERLLFFDWMKMELADPAKDPLALRKMINRAIQNRTANMKPKWKEVPLRMLTEANNSIEILFDRYKVTRNAQKAVFANFLVNLAITRLRSNSEAVPTPINILKMLIRADILMTNQFPGYSDELIGSLVLAQMKTNANFD